jgi:hypothetical protein
MKKISIVLLVIIFSIGQSYAKYVQTCDVKYKRDYGWSDYYTVDVTFMSGSELNSATNSYNYRRYKTYAIIFWGDDQASVIQLSSYTGCGSEVSQSCITNKVSNLEGEDQKGVGWEICTRSYCY